MAPGKSGLHVRGEGVRVISIEPWKHPDHAGESNLLSRSGGEKGLMRKIETPCSKSPSPASVPLGCSNFRWRDRGAGAASPPLVPAEPSKLPEADSQDPRVLPTLLQGVLGRAGVQDARPSLPGPCSGFCHPKPGSSRSTWKGPGSSSEGQLACPQQLCDPRLLT